MLELKNVSVRYGTAEAIKDISLIFEQGSVVSVIGANGAGKSTILRAISGLVPLFSGQVFFQNTQIDRLSIDKIVRMGIAHVPEERKLYRYISVMANLKLSEV